MFDIILTPGNLKFTRVLNMYLFIILNYAIIINNIYGYYTLYYNLN